MNIEEISEKDIGELKDLSQRVILECVEAGDSIKNEIIADTFLHIENSARNPNNVFLKYFDEKIWGFILIQEYWNLSDLFVISEAQGKGIGKLLLNAAISRCSSKQHKGFIRVNSSLNAEGFYLRHGFESFTSEKEAPNFVVPLKYNF